ncbi:TRAP transporter small permease subunit [Aliihoeflea sp. 40Bstr573]|uniref:TRAP transporter small permease n=1 Tax=Aliihoeflea sp. 40Bstr573 TaxID=2696467 RepID=UPI002094F6A4|nr:TRAP transporter small permease subunit [Aliihoeflea sp. 40Bstr573]
MSEDNAGDQATRGPVAWVFRGFSVVAGLMVAAMMFITTFDVVGRYFFGRPLYAAFEVTEILMGLTIFAGLPLATAARENITISILVERMSQKVQDFGTRFFELVCAAICFAMGWRMWAYGARLWRTGDQTLELRVPIGLLAQVMAALVILAGLAFLINALRGRQLLPAAGNSVE